VYCTGSTPHYYVPNEKHYERQNTPESKNQTLRERHEQPPDRVQTGSSTI
jgi:hypothetical protein